MFYTAAAIITESAPLEVSDQGLFGFLMPEHMTVSFLGYGLMSGFWGSAGYVVAAMYFSPLVVMNSFLLEPGISQVIGVFIGIDEWPGPMTWCGILTIILAVNLLKKGTDIRKLEF